MNRKAQIYILAALIFAAVIYGLSTIPNIVRQEEFKGDFEKLSANYNIESSRLINSVITSGGNVTDAFTKFTVLFMSYSKSQNPNFGLIYSLSYQDKIRIGNYLEDAILIDTGGEEGITRIEGCFEKVTTLISFEGMILDFDISESEMEECFVDIDYQEKIFIGFVENEAGGEGEISWYTFEIERNRPQLMVVNLMEEGKQRKVGVAGQGYVAEEGREEEAGDWISELCEKEEFQNYDICPIEWCMQNPNKRWCQELCKETPDLPFCEQKGKGK